MPLKPKYARHPLSAKYGDMEPEQLARMKDSVATHGILEPIRLYEGKVLDGWHRYSCLPAKLTEEQVENWFEEFDEDVFGMTPEEFVEAANVDRRHLTLAQRIAIAADGLGVAVEDRGAKSKIAKAMGISPAAVGQALKAQEVKEKAPKEKAAPTLEGLQKRRALLQAQLDAVDKQIDELQSSAKPKAPAGRAVARRTR